MVASPDRTGDPGSEFEALRAAELHRKRIVSRVLAASGALVSLVAGTLGLVREQYFRAAIVLGVGLVSLAAFFALGRVRRPDLINLPALACVAVLTVYLLATGGTERSGTIWVMITPPLLFFALGLRLGGALAAVFLAGVLAVLFLPGQPLLSVDYSLDYKLRILPALLFVAAVSFVFELTRARSQTRYEAEIRERRRAERAAWEADRAKSAFLAKLSHEVRTPLNGILGLGRLMEAELPPAGGRGDRQHSEAHRLLESMLRSGEDLKTLVDDLLDLAAVEAGHLRLEPGPTSLRALCREVVEPLLPRAREKGLGLVWEISPEVPDRVRADARRLRQVLSNLLQNGLKYTSEGEVRLAVTREPDPGRLVFRVSDTGPGIPVGERVRIFERFWQGAAAACLPSGGVGLGLAICQEIVRAMGGSIELVPDAGAGAVFRVELPLEPLEPPDTTPAPVSPPALRSGARVLLAEDDPISQLVARTMLARLGLEVVLATDGQVALEFAAAERFDLILLDCRMPRVDGRETARRIRAAEAARPEGRRTPILALTAGVTPEEQAACLEAGMDGVLAKPVEPEPLHRALAKWLGKR
jgi:signal transduction histidine kinase/ActR/RegA family two-component response regulator